MSLCQTRQPMPMAATQRQAAAITAKSSHGVRRGPDRGRSRIGGAVIVVVAPSPWGLTGFGLPSAGRGPLGRPINCERTLAAASKSSREAVSSRAERVCGPAGGFGPAGCVAGGTLTASRARSTSAVAMRSGMKTILSVSEAPEFPRSAPPPVKVNPFAPSSGPPLSPGAAPLMYVDMTVCPSQVLPQTLPQVVVPTTTSPH